MAGDITGFGKPALTLARIGSVSVTDDLWDHRQPSRAHGNLMQRLIALCLLLGGLFYSPWGARSVAAAPPRPALGLAPADTSGTLTVNGYDRHFVYAVSAAAAPALGRPLVIYLHGDGGTMGLSAAWKSAVLADSLGAVLLSAEGRNNIPDAAAIDGSAWRYRMDEASQPYDDVDFINQLITQATDAGAPLLGTPIDPAQVYVVGASRGAGFAYYLYADLRTRNKVRAIVPLSGTFYCDGSALNPGTQGTTPTPGSDTTCGTISDYGYWGPKPTLFTTPGVTRAPHILDVHGQLPPDGHEGSGAGSRLSVITVVRLGGRGRLLHGAGELADRAGAGPADWRQAGEDVCLQPDRGGLGHPLRRAGPDLLCGAGRRPCAGRV